MESFQPCFGFVILDSYFWGENCNTHHLANGTMARLALGRARQEQPGSLVHVILDEQGVSRHDGLIFSLEFLLNGSFLL